MSLRDIINLMEEARDSGKRHVVDTHGLDFLMSLGIDPRDYGFIVVEPGEMKPIKPSYYIAGPYEEYMATIEGIAVMRCEAQCETIVAFLGINLHPLMTVICPKCRKEIDGGRRN